ncbi:AraC family transcriptional regulator [Novosphingobium sp.]|uniref:AraC family transcriptional regulator n=1 Tax=Novosphingobium sp. TaxID=1874826 RepID=UPI0031DCCAAD
MSLAVEALTARDTHGIALRPEHQILATSDDLNWSSLYASRQVEQPHHGRYSARNSHFLALHLSGPVAVEREMRGHVARAKVRPGGMLLMPAGCDFSVRLDARSETLHLYVPDSVLRVAAAELCKGDPERIEILPRLGDHDPLIERLGQTCCKMLAEGLGDYFADGVSRWLAAQMVAAHSTGLRRAEPKVTGLSAGQLRKVSGFIEENLEDPLNIEDIAAVVGLNPIHFARQFKRSTGKPPYQFVIEKRVERARELLAADDMPIAQVAAAAGFSHQEHLTRVFGRQTGMTPGAYRRSLLH